MNKKLITLAVATAMAAPASAMAEAVLYGKLHMSIDYADVDSFGTIADTDNAVSLRNLREGFNGWGLNSGGDLPGQSRANRVGVKGSEDLGNGLKAIYQVELGIRMTEEGYGNAASGANDTITMRNSFVGLAGNWGTFLVGRHDSPMKISTGKLDLFADTMADFNGTVGFDDNRFDNAIAYISPSFSGFQLAAATHAGGGSTLGFGENVNADSLAEGYSLAGIYSNGPFYATVSYESIGDELLMGSTASLAGPTNAGYAHDDFTKWRIGLGLLDWNGFTLAAVYEEQTDIQDPNVTTVSLGNPALFAQDLSLWQIQAAYAFGNNQVKAMYGNGSRDTDLNLTRAGIDNALHDAYDGDYNTWAIGFDHNFSKRTKAYVLYTQVDDDFDYNSWDGFSLGMIHKF
ncbi:porin [Marichromatium bheemlicum]|uniref:Porin n=1 Tax=Marichromatium bheemlicum TaxID=365339 RepID=A0ABX1I507_9GAMM|nr:porin [Marichromatium bheemlicum]NKN32243.1 porin [Marichromatium bheemlicum]